MVFFSNFILPTGHEKRRETHTRTAPPGRPPRPGETQNHTPADAREDAPTVRTVDRRHWACFGTDGADWGARLPG